MRSHICCLICICEHDSRTKRDEQNDGAMMSPYTDNKKNDLFSKGSSSSGSVSRGSKITTVVCKNCGRQGHVSVVCPHKKSPEQIHTIAAEPDDALESSGEDNVLILAQVDEVFVSSTTTATPGSQRPPT